jgi:hypothetical protein
VAYLVVFAILVTSGTSRANYLAPAYTWLLAAGGLCLERWTAERPTWLRPAALVAVALGGLLRAPFGLPVLGVDGYVAYARALGVQPSTAERKALRALPQFYADMHGWDRIVDQIAGIVRALPPKERAQAVVFAPNYGVAGAVEVLGRAEGLRAISGHNNYWLWGPQGATGEVVLVVGGEEDELRQQFDRVERVGVTECGHCMPYENGVPLFLCRGLRGGVLGVWAGVKHFD